MEAKAQVTGTLRATDRIASTLIERIRSGRLSVGDAVPTERELCSEFDASRPTVREALALLQHRGFVASDAGKRPRVTRPSVDNVLIAAAANLKDVLGDAESTAYLEQMRQFVEAGAVRNAAERATSIQIANIQTALQANFDAIGTTDFAETDIAFHRAIVAVVGNPVILRLHDLFVSSFLARRPKTHDLKAHHTLTYSEHRQIFQAILDRNVTLGTRLIEDHLARSFRSRLSAPEVAIETHGEAENDSH